MLEEPLEQERFKRQLIATARSLKKKQQQLQADQDLLVDRWTDVLQPKNTASDAQPRVIQSEGCYLSSMKRRRSPYLPRVMRPIDRYVVGTVRQTDHHVVGIERQLKPNNSLPHCHTKLETKQFGVIHTTSGRPWIVEQDIPDRFTDREDIPRHVMMATYSDVTNLVTPGPTTADGLRRSYVAMRLDIEAPHTLFASLMK